MHMNVNYMVPLYDVRLKHARITFTYAHVLRIQKDQAPFRDAPILTETVVGEIRRRI